MNPYDFVRFAGEPERTAALGRMRFQGLTGSVTCTVTVRTPFFTLQPSLVRRVELPTGGEHEEASFPLRDGRPVAPASALKGMLRTVAEAASRSCVTLFDGRYDRGSRARDVNALLPPAYRRCQRPDALCPTCRLFGTTQFGTSVGLLPHAPVVQSVGHGQRVPPSASPAWEGCIAVSDAIALPDQFVLAEPFTIAPQSPPQPRHEAFYLMNGRLAGRKFYIHQPGGPRPEMERTPENRTIQPLVPGSKLQFTVDYELLTEEDRRLLLYSLVLEPSLAHKLGLGKPLGLGSVKVSVTRIEERDAASRYRPGHAESPHVLEGDELRQFLEEELRPFWTGQSFFLFDLRRVLRLDHRETVGYPSAAWFLANPTVPLRQVNAPGQRAGLIPPQPLPRRPEPETPPRPVGAPSRRVEPSGVGVARQPMAPLPPLRQPSGQPPPVRQPAAAQPPRPAPPPEPAVAEEPERAYTLSDLLTRFGKTGGNEVERPPERQTGSRKPTRADRAREDQRRLVERLRGDQQRD